MILKFEVSIDIKDDEVDITKFPKELYEYLDKAYYVGEVILVGKEKQDE